MNKQKLLDKLTELYNIKELQEGFPSQQACIDWANKVAPLLKFNNQYYYNFLQNAHKINLPLSSYTLVPALNIMKSQIQMALEELKYEIENEDQTPIEMMNPLEKNATLLLKLMVDSGKKDYMYKWFSENSQLSQLDLNDAVEYLEDLGAIKVIRTIGNPSFAAVSIQSRGKYLYHELNKKTANEIEFSLPQRPLNPIGSPYGFKEEDWEDVSSKKKDQSTLYVVLGLQFKSEYYDTEKIKKNVKSKFETAVKDYNQKSKNQTKLHFISLTAGYGEHLFNKIARDIIGSDIGVFETSDFNPNVMLEMGIALTWGCSVLPIKKVDRPNPPSDISGQTWIEYDDSGSKFIDNDFGEKLIEMIGRSLSSKIKSSGI